MKLAHEKGCILFLSSTFLYRDEISYIRQELKEQEKLKIAEAKALAEKLKAAKIEFNQKAGDTGRLYGAVTSQEISDALAKIGIHIDKKLFDIKEPIKEAGTHTVKVNIYKEVKSQLTVVINAIN